ncbi:MAG TPA: hypothetical protein DCY88_12055 [Cyanobacteria bacterium UBA11372]|nr:hypothetical protein [Cyanobacteria bacterium UBA11372]
MSKWTVSKITFIAVSTALLLQLIHGYLPQVYTPKFNFNLNLPSWAMVCFLVVSGLALLLMLGFFVGFVMLVSEFNLVSNVTNEYDSFDGLGAGEPYLCQESCSRSPQLSKTKKAPAPLTRLF